MNNELKFEIEEQIDELNKICKYMQLVQRYRDMTVIAPSEVEALR